MERQATINVIEATEVNIYDIVHSICTNMQKTLAELGARHSGHGCDQELHLGAMHAMFFALDAVALVGAVESDKRDNPHENGKSDG